MRRDCYVLMPRRSPHVLLVHSHTNRQVSTSKAQLIMAARVVSTSKSDWLNTAFLPGGIGIAELLASGPLCRTPIRYQIDSFRLLISTRASVRPSMVHSTQLLCAFDVESHTHSEVCMVTRRTFTMTFDVESHRSSVL